MTRALAWIRKSKGSDDDIGLKLQREEVPTLAKELADNVDTLDLGVQSGFSTLTRNDPDGLLDQRDDVRDTVVALRRGEYDMLVAWDDRRVCRDEYYSVIKHGAVQGECEFVYVSDDVQTDNLAFDIHRRVERQTKEEEIKKAKRAIHERRKNGCYQGTVPFGLTYASDKCHLQRDNEEWDVVKEVIERRERGESVRAVADVTDVSPSSVSRIANRGVEWFEDKLSEYGV